MDKWIGFGLHQSRGNRGSVGCASMPRLRWSRWGVGRGLEGWVCEL